MSPNDYKCSCCERAATRIYCYGARCDDHRYDPDPPALRIIYLNGNEIAAVCGLERKA